MTAKKKSSRHLPPSMVVLAERADRKLNVISKTLKTMLPHWERLIREKEILHGQVETLVAENAVLRKTQCKCPPAAADKYMAEPLNPPTAYNGAAVPTLKTEKNAALKPSGMKYEGTTRTHFADQTGHILVTDSKPWDVPTLIVGESAATAPPMTASGDYQMCALTHLHQPGIGCSVCGWDGRGPIHGEPFKISDIPLPAHVYSPGGRCLRCDRLKVAIEASGLPCTDPFGDTA